MTWQAAALLMGALHLLTAVLSLTGHLRLCRRPSAASPCLSCPLRLAPVLSRVPLATAQEVLVAASAGIDGSGSHSPVLIIEPDTTGDYPAQK